jgi:hypothetical protein
MTVYVVLSGDLIGHVKLYGVYADEIDALRAANETVFRVMIPFEVIPAGMSEAPGRDKA